MVYIRFISNSILLILIILKPVQEEWKLARDKEGIKIYVGEGPKNMLNPYRAEMIVTAKPDEIVSLLRDVDRYPEWSHLCIESRLINKKSENDFSVYYINKAPWPVRNRDNCTTIRIEERGDGSVMVTLRDVPSLLPPQKTNVRIPYLEGFWLLERLDDETTKVLHQVQADPGGAVPKWLANMSVTDTPWKTLRNMRAIVEK